MAKLGRPPLAVKRRGMKQASLYADPQLLEQLGLIAAKLGLTRNDLFLAGVRQLVHQTHFVAYIDEAAFGTSFSRPHILDVLAAALNPAAGQGTAPAIPPTQERDAA